MSPGVVERSCERLNLLFLCQIIKRARQNFLLDQYTEKRPQAAQVLQDVLSAREVRKRHPAHLRVSQIQVLHVSGEKGFDVLLCVAD